MLKLIKALYRVIAGEFTLVSWEFDQRSFKKANMLIKQVLTENNIKSFNPKAEWPHISVALVQGPTKEERNKIKLAAPLFEESYKIVGIEILPGVENVDYISFKLQAPEAHTKYFQFLIDLLGDDRVQKPKSYPKFKPHASIATIEKKDIQEVEKLLPLMQKVTARYFTTYKPEHILIWDDYEIAEIEKALL